MCIVTVTISTGSWLLDGFPRTGVQAEAMRKAGINADHFILLNVPDETLIERCFPSNFRSHNKCMPLPVLAAECVFILVISFTGCWEGGPTQRLEKYTT